MTLYKEYLSPRSIQEAVEELSSAAGTKAVVAGGTDLLLDIRQGRHDPVDKLIDVSEIKELQEISEKDGFIYIGACVTHKQIVTSPLLIENAQCVVEGCGLIGGPQVRNVATIGGNVSHALPAGDGTISLLALDTEVQLSSPDGITWQPLIDIFSGPGKVTFDRDREIVTGFRFAIQEEREASAFHRVMRPQGVAIAILNMASWIRLAADGSIEKARISCGPAGPKPFRATQTESFLAGKVWDESVHEKAVELLSGEVSLRTSKHRATKEYRHQILPVLLQKVMEKALERAGD